MYAGTWSHDAVGGHLFGRIERIEDDEATETGAEGTEPEEGEAMEEPKAITIQHILISFDGRGTKATRTQEEAIELVDVVKQKIAAGEDFDELVKEYTDDSHPGIYKMVNHGEQGDRSGRDPSEWVFERRGMVPGFGDVGFTLELDEVGVAEFDLNKSPYGWHIIKRIK